MKVIISCCNRKNGELFIHNGSSINFVSVSNEKELCFHPDDLIRNGGGTWRNLIMGEQGISNKMLPAHALYHAPIYEALFEKYGNDLYIFSAGWGIVRADYKLPKYNITFSHNQNTPIYARRYKDSQNLCNDFKQLEGIDPNEELIFIAGSDYVIPFCKLTKDLVNKKIIIYTSDAVLKNNQYLNNNNFTFIKYQTKRRTNWHYEFANKLIKGESNMKTLENIMAVEDIRSEYNKSINAGIRYIGITREPIVYYWWFKICCFEGLFKLLNAEIKYEKILTETINGVEYGLLYIGQGVNGNNRLIKYHILDSQNFHAIGVENGFLSSLRQTLCGLLKWPMTQSREDINTFMDTNCLVAFQISTLQELNELEHAEIRKHYLPLNHHHTIDILTPEHRRILRDCKRAMRH